MSSVSGEDHNGDALPGIRHTVGGNTDPGVWLEGGSERIVRYPREGGPFFAFDYDLSSRSSRLRLARSTVLVNVGVSLTRFESFAHTESFRFSANDCERLAARCPYFRGGIWNSDRFRLGDD